MSCRIFIRPAHIHHRNVSLIHHCLCFLGRDLAVGALYFLGLCFLCLCFLGHCLRRRRGSCCCCLLYTSDLGNDGSHSGLHAAQHPAHHQVGAERRIEQGNGREDDKGRDDRG